MGAKRDRYYFYFIFDANVVTNWAVKYCLIALEQRRSLIVITRPVGGINLHYFLNPSVLLSVKSSMWEHLAVLWHYWSSDSKDNGTDRHKQAERDITNLLKGDWSFSPVISVCVHTRHPHNCRNRTAADRLSISKSQLKSSSKRIRSSIYTLAAGSFPEMGAKQITDTVNTQTQGKHQEWNSAGK